MEKNIIALLNINLRVIIPDFGAFIIKQKEPRIVVFNEFLRYNDGLIIEYIAKTEGIEREIAEQLVLDYADESTKVLGSGKMLVIEGLGSLQKDKSGKVNFIDFNTITAPEIPLPEVAENEPLEKKTKPKPKLKPKPKPKPKQSVKAAVKTVASKPVKPSVSIAAEEPAIDKEPEDHDAPVEFLADVILTEAHDVVPDEKQEVVPVATVEPKILISATVTEQSGSKTVMNPINRILVWVLLILFANASIIAWFVFRDEIKGLFSRKSPDKATDSLFDQLADSVKAAATDTSLVYYHTEESLVTATETTMQEGTRYYIVAGCFRDEANAEALVTFLKQKGFNAEKFGKIGNLYAVCFASFEDKEKAVNELKRIREQAPDAWMTRF